MAYIFFFNEVNENFLSKIGKKAFNLAMLFKKGFRVPPGFIIDRTLASVILDRKDFRQMVNDILRCPEHEIEERSRRLQNMIRRMELPDEIADEIAEAYLSLPAQHDNLSVESLLETSEVYVAVRSSFIEDDLPHFSHKTILNVRGIDKLVRTVLDCYASVFAPEIIIYMRKNNMQEFPLSIIIQKMVESEKSGIAFSINPETKNPDEILIRACFGLGQGMASESVFPDIYILDKKEDKIKGVKVADKQYQFVMDIDTEQTVKQEAGHNSNKQVLDEYELENLSKTIKKVVKAFGKEIEIEWSIKKDVLYILQAKEIPFAGSIGEESVEMEITGNEEEKPEMLDISDEEDIEALEEIEKIENPPAEETEYIDINEMKEKEVEKDEMEKSGIEFKEIDLPEPEEEKMAGQVNIKEDDFIIPGYNKEPEPIKHEHNKFTELAKLNAGNALVYCHMAIKENLKKRLRGYITEIPDNFIMIINELSKFEKIENIEDLKRLDKARNEFVNEMRYPDAEELGIGFRLINE